MHFSWCANIVNFQDHLHELGSKEDLLLLAVQGLNHMLFLHICVTI